MSGALEPNSDARAGLAIITGSQNPYRLHLHRRIIREIPEVKLWSVYTHGIPDQAWAGGPAPDTNPVEFGAQDPVTRSTDPGRALREWAKGGRVVRWLREQRIAAVLIGGYAELGRLRIIRWCARAGVPCFLVTDSNIHGDTARGLKRLAKTALLRWVLRRVRGVMPCGRYGVEYFRRYGVEDSRVWLAPYEPDYGLIQDLTDQQIREATAKHGLEPARRRVVFCGRMVEVKRPDLALGAFLAIAAERPEWDLVMIGDGPMRKSLEASVPTSLRERVRWTGFIGDQREISAIYRASRVFVLPSDFEPWGVVVNEAAAAGLAMVATNVVGAAADLVREGENGRLVPPSDTGALRVALLETTEAAGLEARRAASLRVLEDWRRRADPVAGIRAALAAAGVLGRG